MSTPKIDNDFRSDCESIEPSTRQAKRATLWALYVALAGVTLVIGAQLLLFAHFAQSTDRVQSITALAGELLLHDDHLTTTAHLAIVTGDRAWVDEYELASVRMGHDLSKVASVAPPELKGAIDEASKANEELVDMEQLAFARLQAGDREGANMLLADKQYRMQKEFFVNHLRSLRNRLLDVATGDGERLRHLFIWIALVTLGIIIGVFIAAWWRIKASILRATNVFKFSQAHLQWVATHDELTGLPNRRLLLERKNAYRDQLKGDQRLAVFILDLDRFKPINDRYGHRVGDEVIKVAGKRLADTLAADEGVVARIGGDEFCVLLLFNDHDVDAPSRLAERMLQVVRQPIQIANLSLEVGMSIGYAVRSASEQGSSPFSHLDGSRTETILRHADMALHAVKTEGGGRYRCFEPVMDQELVRRVELEREIGPAIEAGDIVPFYQPIVDMRSERVLGYEVLARWHHPTKGLLAPAEFISIAENTGTIGAMTRQLLRQAIKDCKAWPKEIYLSINLSPVQFQDPWLLGGVLAVASAASFPLRRLHLEITENAFVENIADATQIVETLKRAGVKVALDDFGAGYAGIRYLRDFKFDILKIDRSLIQSLDANSQDRAVVKAILRLARSLKMQVVAEGIESSPISNALKEIGCPFGQGYHFGTPQAAAEVEHSSTMVALRQAPAVA